MFRLTKSSVSLAKYPKNYNAFNGLSMRSATTISSPNDNKLTDMLAKLDKFDSESKIFDKLDALYLLSQRKGFFNLNSNNLEFLSNNNKINDNMNNLYNFNNLNRLVSNQYSDLLMLPTSPSAQSLTSSSFNDITKINSANLSPIPRTGNKPNIKVASTNPNFFDASTYPSVANAIPGLNAFSSIPVARSNAPVDKYLNLLQGLARNDVELKNKIEQVLEAFNNEDDAFFNYVLEFWISGKSFNKKRAKKLQGKLGDNQLPSNLRM
jgi:hypothetical protein